ncbi:SMODS domain-containing nucleotidyltransferase [Adhaeribacter aquaticus]|uniref:SMODS domain-containing nucleotidyltransferase n=1 Tax=Adhaeribacter aquaticus TaxID=299567 RepID=UPI000412411C|nr:nucleotidyltransferase [Adhaeribacter aquaticus]
MDIAKIFGGFVNNLVIENQTNIESRFATITKRLNLDFYGLNSNTENGIYIGSYGRNTAINGVSDLDIIFELPSELYYQYNNRVGNKQSQLLQDVRNSISKTYSQSKVRGDGQVVVVEFKSDFIEVCPAFKETDNSFTYPDSNYGGSWKKTNPLPEAKAILELDKTSKSNLVNLCRIARAWKNKNGVKINGLLIDTFAYNFIKQNSYYATLGFDKYDEFVQGFFYYLKELDSNRKFWFAPGSNQKVYKKKSNFSSKAKKAYNLISEAIKNNESKTVYEIWRRVFGSQFPYPREIKELSLNFTNKEEFIEDKYPINIKNFLSIDCEVTQAGFRVGLLKEMVLLKKNKNLRFFIKQTDVSQPYEILWKVKNEGKLAYERGVHRGQIISSNLNGTDRTENSTFEGSHFVECYLIKDGFCVARDRIDVPILNG